MLVLRILLTSQLLPNVSLHSTDFSFKTDAYRSLAKYYTRRFWVITRSLSSWCPPKLESKSAQKNCIKSCETEQFADAHLSGENFWFSLELALCATALLCADHCLRSHDLTGRKILSFPECRLISPSPSERQKVSTFSCWHHDPKTDAEIKDSFKMNPHGGPSRVHGCFTWFPVVLCSFYCYYTWPDSLGHLVSPFAMLSVLFLWVMFFIIREDSADIGTN